MEQLVALSYEGVREDTTTAEKRVLDVFGVFLRPQFLVLKSSHLSVSNLVRLLRLEHPDKIEVTSPVHADILYWVGITDSHIQARRVGNRFLKVWCK